MSLNLNGNVTGIYLGSTKADAVYLGNVKVFESTPTAHIGSRDYKIVTIGSLVWMAEPLREEISGYSTSSGTFGDIEYFLYSYSAAYAVAGSIEGWRLPTQSEYTNLLGSLSSAELLDYMDESSGGNGSAGFNLSRNKGESLVKQSSLTQLTDLSLWTASSGVVAGIKNYSSNSRSFFTESKTTSYQYSVRLVKTA